MSIRLIYLFFTVIYTAPCIANNQKNSLSLIETQYENQKAKVLLHFNKKINTSSFSLLSHPGFVQIDLPSTNTSESGKFLDGDSKIIAKVAPFQVSPDKSIVRIYTTKKFNESKNNPPKTLVNDKTLTILLKKEKLTAAAPVALSDDTFNNYIIKLSLLALALLLVLLGYLTTKRFNRNRMINSSGNNYTTLKLINQIHLSPKIKLTVVQVGGENILLSVSPDGASMLTKIKVSSETSQEPKKVFPKEFGERETLKSQIKQDKKIDGATYKDFTKTLHRHLNKDDSSISDSITMNTPNQKINRDQNLNKNKGNSASSIDEITDLIRSKLKSLPRI